jgi:hypothetical protein
MTLWSLKHNFLRDENVYEMNTENVNVLLISFLFYVT